MMNLNSNSHNIFQIIRPRLRALGYLADNLMGVRLGPQTLQEPEDNTGGEGEHPPLLPVEAPCHGHPSCSYLV